MEDGKRTDAAAAYRRAAESGEAYDTREAIWYLGLLYLAEKVTEGNEQYSTGYLLAVDPASGLVLQRYRLPDPPTGFSAQPDGFRILYQYGEDKEASIGFSIGQFDRPLFYGGDFASRRKSWRAGERRWSRRKRP